MISGVDGFSALFFSSLPPVSEAAAGVDPALSLTGGVVLRLLIISMILLRQQFLTWQKGLELRD